MERARWSDSISVHLVDIVGFCHKAKPACWVTSESKTQVLGITLVAFVNYLLCPVDSLTFLLFRVSAVAAAEAEAPPPAHRLLLAPLHPALVHCVSTK